MGPPPGPPCSSHWKTMMRGAAPASPQIHSWLGAGGAALSARLPLGPWPVMGRACAQQCLGACLDVSLSLSLQKQSFL